MRIPRMANLIVLVGLLITAAGCTTVGVNVHELGDWKTGKLGHLSRYIGTTKYEAVFNDPFVRWAMEELLGDNVSHLLQNMEVRSPIESEGSELALWGNKAHEAHLENAILIVDIYDGSIHAGIFSNGQTTIFSKVDKETGDYFEPEVVYGFLPGALRQWVRWDEIRELRRLAPQTNFRWVK